MSAGVRADPKTVTARGTSASRPKPSTNSLVNPQHAPRVGVDPVGGAARVEQPLVGGPRLDLRPAKDDRATLALGQPGGSMRPRIRADLVGARDRRKSMLTAPTLGPTAA